MTGKYSDNLVVIMAGGLGSRLGELTRHIPKPMLRLGNQPVLEYLVRSFAQQGFNRFVFCVKYKSEVIRAYFGDGSGWKVHISYVEEPEDYLGTAGPLSLIYPRPKSPFIVVNGDIFTTLNFEKFFNSHVDSGAIATMGVQTYKQRIPFGVVESEGGRIVSLEEKPEKSYHINVGIYAFQPEIIDWIPYNQYLDTIGLFHNLLGNKLYTSSYLVDEFWMDIGHKRDYEDARKLLHETHTKWEKEHS